MDVIIRDTSVDDAESLAFAFDIVARERKYILTTQGGSKEQTIAHINYLNQIGGIHQVAIVGEEVVGFCTVGFAPFEGFNHAGRLGMGILPAFRQQKIGTPLLGSVVDNAFSKPIERVELEVFASNAVAVELYKKFGFIEEGRKIKARKLDGVYEDIILMAVTKEQFKI
jgi:RimJ/RimL family protein N-acetyltransferase